jgi:uncharacterized protein (TIGR03067 family)
MNRPVLLAVGLACLAGLAAATAAPAPKVAKEDKGDLKKLEGDWTIESWTQFGQPIAATWTWSFKGEKYTLDQGTNLEEGTIKLDPKKEPPVMDLDITGGNCRGKAQPGIYKLDGDTLTLCFAWPGDTDRPTEFASTADKRWVLITLKRAKK